MATLTSCPVCGYPIQAHFEGETSVCANCGEQLEAVGRGIQSPPATYPSWWGKTTRIGAIEIPTPIFAGGLGFLLGMFLGPALLASTDVGKRWLEKRVAGG